MEIFQETVLKNNGLSTNTFSLCCFSYDPIPADQLRASQAVATVQNKTEKCFCSFYEIEKEKLNTLLYNMCTSSQKLG